MAKHHTQWAEVMVVSSAELSAASMEDVIAATRRGVLDVGVTASALAHGGSVGDARRVLDTARNANGSLGPAAAAADAFLALQDGMSFDAVHRILERGLADAQRLDAGHLNELLGMLILTAHISDNREWWDSAAALSGSMSERVDPVNAMALWSRGKFRELGTEIVRPNESTVIDSVKAGPAWKGTLLNVVSALVDWRSGEGTFIQSVLLGEGRADHGWASLMMHYEVLGRRRDTWSRLVREGSRDLAFAERSGHDYLAARLHGYLAQAEAYLGNEQSAIEHSEAALEWALPRAHRIILADAWDAQVVLSVAKGQFEDVHTWLGPLSVDPVRWTLSRHGIAEVFAFAEASAAIGRGEDAAEKVSAAWAFGIDTQSLAQSMLLRAASAIIETDPSRADDVFGSALSEQADVTLPFESARVRLAYGIFVRDRIGDPARARALIRRAIQDFDILGASLFARRARRELSSTGPGDAHNILHELLSPHEVQVVTLAAQGLSNKDIAAKLFVSHRTVAYHLYNSFPKLNVKSRGGLRDALLDLGAQANGTGTPLRT